MKRDIKLQYEKCILVVPIVCAVVQPIDFIRIYKYRGRFFSIHLPYTYIQLILSIPYTFLYAFHMCCMPYTYAPYICPTYNICHIHNALYTYALYVCPIYTFRNFVLSCNRWTSSELTSLQDGSFYTFNTIRFYTLYIIPFNMYL